jgi:hypothetical protein
MPSWPMWSTSTPSITTCCAPSATMPFFAPVTRNPSSRHQSPVTCSP